MSSTIRKPRVSVVIAAYNAGNYLAEAVESVLAQTIADLELIVVDDGSTDGSAASLSGVRDSRLRVVRQENAGQTRAKNRGIEESRGEIIGFCDADDFWYPNKLELQLPLFERSETVGVVYSAAQKIDSGGEPIESTWATPYRGNVVEQLFMRNFVPFGTAMVKRICLDQVGAFNESFRMGIDWDLWLRISTRFEFDFTEENTYAYRIWSGQMSSNWRGRYDCAFRIMAEFVAANPDSIAPQLYRKAKANTYANKARARVAETPFAAVGDAIRAVFYDPAELFNWKTVARVPLEATEQQFLDRPRMRKTDRLAIARRIGAPIARLATRGVPRIFMYHRFGDQTGPQKLGLSDFNAQLDYLNANCVVLPLCEALDAGEGRFGRKPIVALTVDDGYTDFKQLAYPALVARKMVATLFVTTGFVERELSLWPDVIRVLIASVPQADYELDGYWRGFRFSTRTAESRELAWHLLADQLLFKPEQERASALDELLSSTGMSLADLDLSDYSALNWDDLREMSANGFEIGDHTWSHAFLPSASDSELAQQMSASKQLIESRLQTPVRSFAYPNGGERDVSQRLVDEARKTGYEFAVTSIPTKFDRHRPHEVGRMSGHVDASRFAWLTSGYGLLRNRNRINRRRPTS